MMISEDVQRDNTYCEAELSIPRPPIGITYGGRGIDHCMKREGGAMSIN